MRPALVRLLAALSALWLGLALAGVAAAATAPVTQTAIFAGGCFWCMEDDVRAIHGVVSVDSGYTGGRTANPSYQDVLTEKTGHYEAVRVRFDPGQITYRQLVDRYWKLVDPTDNGGQFCDRGPSYRPVVFVDGPNQRKAAEQSRAAATRRLKTGKMVAQVLPAGAFYMAEPYHRNFAQRNKSGYEIYRIGCGRDARLIELWGKAG
jgi:peptide-methionine (S)-S-oxide reductase